MRKTTGLNSKAAESQQQKDTFLLWRSEYFSQCVLPFAHLSMCVIFSLNRFVCVCLCVLSTVTCMAWGECRLHQGWVLRCRSQGPSSPPRCRQKGSPPPQSALLRCRTGSLPSSPGEMSRSERWEGGDWAGARSTTKKKTDRVPVLEQLLCEIKMS